MGKCSERSIEALKDKKASRVVKDSQSTAWLDYWGLKIDLTALEEPTWRAEIWLQRVLQFADHIITEAMFGSWTKE